MILPQAKLSNLIFCLVAPQRQIRICHVNQLFEPIQLRTPNSKGINLIHTHVPTDQPIIKETEQESDTTRTDQTR